jgi:calcineurin-like phosphoesterase family protein
MNAEKLFFCGDTHFGHKTMLKYGRSFTTVEEMDEALIANWNAVVPADGTVIHLGDFSFRNRAETKAIIARLNGRIELIRGNHDRDNMFEREDDYREIRVGGQKIILCHYAFESWNQMHYGSWHLHGHSHGNLRRFGKRLDVGVDCHNLSPIPYSKAEFILSLRPIESADHHKPKS